MNHFCAAAALIGANMCEGDSAITLIERSFMTHMSEYGLSYATKEEYAFRLDLFAKKDAFINEMNADKTNTFELGHNQFSTWTEDELKRIKGYKGDETHDENAILFDGEPVSNGVDWRAKGGVNTPRNQLCGDCWAFSTVASLEGAHFAKSGKLLSLSEQMLVDCDKVNSGCNGGYPDKAFGWVKSNGGIAARPQYPYVGKRGTCKKVASAVQVTAVNRVQKNSVAALKAAVEKSVVSIGIQSTGVLDNYKGGIINNPKCGTALDHAVNIVGWGSASGQDYFIVRNSWGPKWGESGYARVAAVNGPGICGIQMDPSFPTTN